MNKHFVNHKDMNKFATRKASNSYQVSAFRWQKEAKFPFIPLLQSTGNHHVRNTKKNQLQSTLDMDKLSMLLASVCGYRGNHPIFPLDTKSNESSEKMKKTRTAIESIRLPNLPLSFRDERKFIFTQKRYEKEVNHHDTKRVPRAYE